MKIYKISGSIDRSGTRKRITEMELKECGKSYVGDGIRINKDKLMKLDTIFNETHKLINYFTYCIDGDQQKALDMIKNHIIKKVEQYKSEIDEIVLICSNWKNGGDQGDIKISKI